MAENDRKLSSFDEMGYDNSTKVLVPVVKYSDNTPQAIKENRNIPLELFYNEPLLTSRWIDHLITDKSWLRADTFTWYSGDSQDVNSYEKVYQHLVDDIDGKTLQSETIAGITIQYYLADDTHKICPATEEQNLIDLYNLVGSANYYLLDEENIRFKLPRKKNTNIIRSYRNGSSWYNLYANGWVEQGSMSATNGGNATQIQLLVPLSSNVYSPFIQGITSTDGYSNAQWQVMPVNTTNSPRTTTFFYVQASIAGYNLGFIWRVECMCSVDLTGEREYLYYYVGNYTMSSIENIAGQNMSIVNNKIDIDMNNMNPSAYSKNIIEGWRDINYSAKIQIANNYTITKRGYVWGYNTANDANFALYVNGVYLGGGYTGHNGRFSAYAIVSAGDVITIGGNGPVVFFAPVKGE